jgi:glycosyltransferase involved in cell wall biosynthesis
MRILIGADTYYPDVNGASYFTQRFAEGLVGRGHEVHLVAASRGWHSYLENRDGIVEHRVRSLALPGHPGFRFVPPGVRRHLRNEVQEVAPDLIHVQGHFAIGRTLIAIARQLGIPVVATNHFMPDNLVHYLGLPGPLERLVEAAGWADFARVFNRADRITAPTPFAAALAERKGVRRSVQPISCGLDLSRFSGTVDPAPFRAQYRLDRRPTILFVGRLDAEKHVDELIRALPAVRRQVDAQLVIVGTGHEEARLRELSTRGGLDGHVRFTGFVSDEDLPGAYAAADVAVNPGTAELQSIVTLEAMASGKPVVGANARALPLLVHDAVNGHLFTPGDVAGLAGALTGILTDDVRRIRMGLESRRLMRAHDLIATLDAFEAVYADLGIVPVPGQPQRIAA